MLILAGLVCTFAAVLGGFVLESGNLLVLLQPAELLIICGAALGILLVSHPPATLAGVARGVGSLFRPAACSRPQYLATLKMLYEVFSYQRRAGSSELEKQIEEPGKSPLFQAYPDFLRDYAAVHFLCDSLRIAIAAGVDSTELDRIMRVEIGRAHV